MIEDYATSDKVITTTGEALQAVGKLCRRYIPLFEKIIAIKKNSPKTGEEVFARSASQSNGNNLQELKEIATILLQHVTDIEHQLEQKYVETYDLLKMDDPYLNHILLNMISEAITRIEVYYQGQATSFAILLNDLMRLRHTMQSQLTIETEGFNHNERREPRERRQANRVESDEKMIYIRVFHRDLPKLGETEQGMQCIPVLLEMVKYCEKNGLAVYDSWQLAERSLRNESYGFFSACIKQSQDLSAYSPAKRDRYLDCPLLTVQKIELSQLRQFKHRDKTYWVQKDKLIEVK